MIYFLANVVSAIDGLLALHYVVAMHSNPSSSLIQQLVDIYPLGVQYSGEVWSVLRTQLLHIQSKKTVACECQ
jgi:hypothetical protein